MTMKNKELEAFVTIEYTLLIPVLLLLYTSLIGMGIYLHNRCVLQTNTFLLAVEAARIDFQEGALEGGLLQGKAEQLYNNKYLLAVDLENTLRMVGNNIEITSSGQMVNPLSLIGIGKQMWNFSAESKVNVISPVNTLRLCKKVGRVLRKNEKEGNTGDW